MFQLSVTACKRLVGRRGIKVMAAVAVWVCLLVVGLPVQPAQADGIVKVRVPDECKIQNQVPDWSINSVDLAVKDTIPGEWGYPLSPITYESLKSAAIMVRTRIRWQDENTSPGGYDYWTANIDHLTSQQTPAGCDGKYTMNTVYNGRQHSNTSNYPYDSNGATDATAGQWIVNIGGLVLYAGFDDNVQARSVSCNEQSADWEFCAVSSLAAREFGENNWAARRLNTDPANIIEFQAEAFYERVHPVSGHYWFCYAGYGIGYVPGSPGKCYMQAVPDNGAGFGSNQGYWYNSPQMKYKVAFPVADGSTPWYVWLRGLGCSYSNDSVHIGLNDQPVATAEDMSGWDSCGWTWQSVRMNYSRPYVTPYFYTNYPNGSAFKTLNLWMREDGMRVDKIILTTDPNYIPYP